MYEDDDIVGGEHFLNPDHPWWEHSDAVRHRECFERWEHKDDFEFLAKYRPSFDFEAPHVLEMIEKHGEPYWLIELKNYRASLSPTELERVEKLTKGEF